MGDKSKISTKNINNIKNDKNEQIRNIILVKESFLKFFTNTKTYIFCNEFFETLMKISFLYSPLHKTLKICM